MGKTYDTFEELEERECTIPLYIEHDDAYLTEFLDN